ncbi:MAG: hypothetical protein FJZ01_10665 [Candidatus Sericytochromatia bacterium]|nr:hypothetical protein [Candidatus Tanganyikabacteria bacterium]
MMHTAIGQALALYEQANPKDAKTVLSALRKAFPAEAEAGTEEFRTFLNQTPMLMLAARLNQDGAGWSLSHEAELRNLGLAGDTYFAAYPRAVRRLLDFARIVFGGRKPEVALLSDWRALLERLDGLVPRSRDEIVRYNAAKITKIAIYDISDDPDAAAKRLQNARYPIGRLTKEASGAGLSAQEFAHRYILCEIDLDLPVLKHDQYRARCRHMWNHVVLNCPELGLPEWPARTPNKAPPRESWPQAWNDALHEAVLGKETLAKTTRQNFTTVWGSMLGILQEEGIDTATLFEGLSAKDAVRIAVQGVPRGVLGDDIDQADPQDLARRIAADPALCEAVLAAMRRMEGCRDGRDSRESPFTMVILRHRYAEGEYPAARAALVQVSRLNRQYLGILEGHLKWIDDRLTEVDKLIDKQKTEYDLKKKAIFKNPWLFEDLEARLRGKLVEIVAQADAPYRQWANDLEYGLFAYMDLLFPMRIQQYRAMQILRHLDPVTGKIHFDADEVKNQREIDLELPEGPIMGQVREWLRIYLEKARPILLNGAESPFLFVPDRRAPGAGLCVRRTFFNDVWIKISREWLDDLIPPGVGAINPHLPRHICASYWLVARKNLDRAAQLLNDDPDTVKAYYADELATASEDIKADYSQYGRSDTSSPDAA